jgi:putative transcriptional regulator
MLSVLNIMIHERVEKNIKELRTSLGLTQAQLAKLVGVARVSIVAIEKGRFLPTIETAPVFVSTVRADWLMVRPRLTVVMRPTYE